MNALHLRVNGLPCTTFFLVCIWLPVSWHELHHLCTLENVTRFVLQRQKDSYRLSSANLYLSAAFILDDGPEHLTCSLRPGTLRSFHLQRPPLHLPQCNHSVLHVIRMPLQREDSSGMVQQVALAPQPTQYVLLPLNFGAVVCRDAPTPKSVYQRSFAPWQCLQAQGETQQWCIAF